MRPPALRLVAGQHHRPQWNRGVCWFLPRSFLRDANRPRLSLPDLISSVAPLLNDQTDGEGHPEILPKPLSSSSHSPPRNSGVASLNESESGNSARVLRPSCL